MRRLFGLIFFSVFTILSYNISGAANLAGLPDLTEMIATNTPAVVNISTSRDPKNLKELLKLPQGLEGTIQGEILRRFFEEQEELQKHREAFSLGSGTIISKDGYIITNNHVISNADKILVRLSDKREFVAKVIGTDKGTDLALLKIQGNNLPYATLGDSDKLKVGAWVVAIGSPFGFEHSATAGIVSGKGRNIGRESYVPFIQTDAAVNPGNSGGPLFDLTGNVVGINSQILSKTGGYLGLSFAIPANLVKSVVAQLKADGFVSRGWLGISFQEINTELAKSFGLDRIAGALVASVVDDSPASKAGVKTGDIILQLNNQPILDATQLPAMVGSMKPGTKITLLVFRDGKQSEKTLTTGKLASEEENSKKHKSDANSIDINGHGYDKLGIKVRNLNSDDRNLYNIEETDKSGNADVGGVMISSVAPDSIAANLGLQKGLVILALDMRVIRDVKEYQSIVKSLSANKWVPILVKNDAGNKRYFAFKITK